MIACSEGKDMTGGCGANSEWYPGVTQDLAGNDYQFYANCAKGGGAECTSLHDVENILKGAGIGLAGLATGGIAAGVGGNIFGAAVGGRYVTGALGAITNMAGSVGAQIATGKFDLGDTLIAGVTGFFTGYVMPTNPLQSALTYGTVGAAQYIGTEVVHGRTPYLGLTFRALTKSIDR